MYGGVDPQVQQWFSAVDADRSGRITADELQQALKSSNGRNFSPNVCNLMMGMFDGGSKQLDINGFSQLYQFVNQWINAFKAYDKNQSGYIDASELNSAFQTMGYRFSPQFAPMIENKFRDSPQGLALDTFVMICIMIHKLTSGFRSKDTSQQGMVTISYEDFLTVALSSVA